MSPLLHPLLIIYHSHYASEEIPKHTSEELCSSNPSSTTANTADTISVLPLLPLAICNNALPRFCGEFPGDEGILSKGSRGIMARSEK
jgi:hypothetical protein